MHHGMMIEGHHMAPATMDASMMGGTMMVVGMVGMILALVALGVGVVWLVRIVTRDRDRVPPDRG